jgi:hypothetical protein
MLLETHLPTRDGPPVPEAARFAEAVEADTAQAARDVRVRRNPEWGRVEKALDAWDDGGGVQERVVRRGAELQLRALEDLTTAVDRTPLERVVDSAVREHRARAAEAGKADRAVRAEKDAGGGTGLSGPPSEPGQERDGGTAPPPGSRS